MVPLTLRKEELHGSTLLKTTCVVAALAALMTIIIVKTFPKPAHEG